MPRTTPQAEIDDIRRQMALIRHDMHHEVSGVIQSAERALDWKRLIQNAPWVSIALAGIAGYLVIPRKRDPRAVAVAGLTPEDRHALVEELRQLPLRADGHSGASVTSNGRHWDESTATTRKNAKAGPFRLVSWAARLALPMAVNYAQSYASVWLDEFLRNQTQSRMVSGGPAPQGDPFARQTRTYGGS